MKTLHFYITRHIVLTLLMTVMVFTFVLLLGNALREVLVLIVNGQAKLGMIVKAFGLLIPFVLVFSLPMGMLTATLLVFGRFSADQELTAVRAGGISLVALSSPVFLLSVLASALAAYINMQVAPQCRTAYRFLVYQVGVEQATSFIVEGRWMDGFDNYVIYVGRKNGNELERVLIYELSEEGRIRQKLQAARAELRTDSENFEASLRLYDVDYFNYETWLPGSAAEMEGFKLNYRPPGEDDLDLPISDMTFGQLWRKLNDLEAFAASAVPLDPRDGVAREEQARKVRELRSELTQQVRVQMHRQVAFSFACIGFTLVGIPLGVRAHRRETSVGFAMALLLVAVYYAFIVLAQSLQDRPEFGPHLILWLPNFIFQVVGVALLWRANRGF